MLVYILKRILQGLFVVFGVILLIFIIIRVIPGDPARLIAAGGATPESIEKIRHELGLDRPLAIQFADYVAHVAKGDLGNSIFRSKGGSTHHGVHKFVTESERTDVVEYERAKVLDLILERIPVTLLLSGMAVLFALIIAGSLGIMSALKPETLWDKIATFITIATQSLPNFWVGIVLILIVSVKLKILPAMGYRNFSYSILPSFALSLSLIPIWLRIIRLGLIDVLSSNFITGLRARGIPRGKILFKHALRNAAIPFVTILSVHLGYLLGGAIIIEFVFDYPGLGLLTIVGVLQRDFTVVQGIVVFFASIFVLINILIDIIYVYIDPRISLE
jgi:peptide/nickel transport system permease protein